ncbi:SDR family NAD(P)-dependent oxidoreductase [Chelativorans sp. M5D2P16]|uniref:SDR family NAD(P)-dependent oxidoreductase n=1 Tax=Chelativorans sp. M5D2P16 TaxID=3095678 RepID=UPI002ACA5511|nr:SDR family NAD(P)-dependent oxidoreductase [Chelativorans sp. M5D2P16]MDZ5700018.1 SDR family NAD(P)-dependent oxidoreductase [Chelativorans sp. M5D2P16]
MQNKGTSAVIVGGTQGLGLAVARQLVEEGCRRLVLSGRDREKGRAAATELAALGCEAHFVAADLGIVDNCRALIAEAGRLVGPRRLQPIFSRPVERHDRSDHRLRPEHGRGLSRVGPLRTEKSNLPIVKDNGK